MEYGDDPFVSLMTRTRENLLLLQERPWAEMFEVTFLVNSLFGLLVLPFEAGFVSDVRQLDVTATGVEGMSATFRINAVGGKPPPTDLRRLCRSLRNCVAHCSLRFVSDRGVITGIGFDSRSRQGDLEWSLDCSVDELRTFVVGLSSLAVQARQLQLRRQATLATPR